MTRLGWTAVLVMVLILGVWLGIFHHDRTEPDAPPSCVRFIDQSDRLVDLAGEVLMQVDEEGIDTDLTQITIRIREQRVAYDDSKADCLQGE